MAGGNADNVRGAAFEVEVASGLTRSGETVRHVELNNVRTTKGSTEIDVQLVDGSTIEVKSGNLIKTQADTQQLQRQLAYRNENNLGGNHYVAVGGEISEDMKQFLDQNNIRVLDGARYMS